MSSKQPDGAEERRRASREPIKIPIDYSAVDVFFSEFASNINEGGMFIETDTPAELEDVSCRPLPSMSPVTMSALPNNHAIPDPESRSTPGASISSALERRIWATSGAVKRRILAATVDVSAVPRPSDRRTAAMAAAWGAAAEVPKKVNNPGVAVDTPSAAAMSGF